MRSFAALLLCSLTASSAHTFELHRTAGGERVRWNRRTVQLHLDPSLDRLGDRDAVAAVISHAARRWLVDTDAPLDIELLHRQCAHLEKTSSDRESNCVWASNDSTTHEEKQGAATQLTFHPYSGSIIDADIVFNAQRWRWHLGDVSQRDGELSLAAVATHEIGHLLGLSHSKVPSATMYPRMTCRETTKRSLDGDDVAAVHLLYAETSRTAWRGAERGVDAPGPWETLRGIMDAGLRRLRVLLHRPA